MKKHVIGTFASRADAEKAINYLHNKLEIPTAEISYIYRNTEGDVKQVDAAGISSKTPGEGAQTGAEAGATLGALAGIAATVGMIPIVGPFFAAGPLLAAIGISGAVGTTAAGAVGGAAVGGILGALMSLGVGRENAQRYQDRVMAGDILLAVYAPEGKAVESALLEFNALDVESYSVSV